MHKIALLAQQFFGWPRASGKPDPWFSNAEIKEDWKHIERCIFNYAETTRSDSDYYVGNTVRELCLTRSADFILDTAELNLLIHHLCTS